MQYCPIKNAPAVQNRSLSPEHHERWLIVNEQQEAIDPHTPQLAQLQLEIKFSYLVIRAPGMLRLDIPMDVIEDDEEAFEMVSVDGVKTLAVSEGELAAQWLSVFFGQPLRLMKRKNKA